jgi:hypothetical protein
MVPRMKFTSTLFGTLVVALCAACGGQASPPASPSQTTGSEQNKESEHKESADHEKHHAALSPALKDFHGVIGPIWHSEKGATRVTKTCTDAKALQDKAQATADAELIAAAAALEPACAKEGRPEVEAKLTVVHERFHKLAEKH